MFNVIGQISWLAVAAATVVSFLIAAVWFAAIVGRPYAIALGRQGQPASFAPILLIGPFLCNAVTALASAILIRAMNITTYTDASLFGLIVGLGFLASTTVNTGINPNIPRPMLYGALSGTYFLVAGIVISLIIVAVS